MSDTTLHETIKAGSVITARTSDTAVLVWFYVVAVLPEGKVFGVNLGGNSSYVSPEGSGIRFDTATAEHYGAADTLGRLGSGVLEALTSFLVAAGLPSPRTEGDQSPDDAYRRGVTDGRTEATREFEAWKERATEVAHEYADNNDLCSEFDRCMREIGLPDRGPKSYLVTFRVDLERGSDPYDVYPDTDGGYVEDWSRINVETA